MNRLILLGNGFDLAHGLPTSYTDFIFNYCKKEILCCIEDYLNSRESSFSQPFLGLNFIEEKSNKAPMGNVFKNIKNHINDKEGLLDLISNKIYSIISLNKKEDKDYKALYEYYIEYSNSFVYNLVTENNGQNWSDIEAYYYKKLIDCLGLSNLNGKIEKVKEEILKDVKILNEEFVHVISALGFYLKEYVENKYSFEPQQEFIDILLGNKETESTLLLNFNYTKTAEMYLSHLQKNNPAQLIQIHGKLNYYRQNPMIFGFGDEYDKLYKVMEEFNDNSLFHHIKSFGYFRTNNYRNMESYVESKPYEIFIIGHSCGLSDRTLLKYLFEHENCRSIKIYHYQDKENDFFKSRNNYINVTQEISRHFDKKEEMRSVIVPFNQKDFCPQVQLKKIAE